MWISYLQKMVEPWKNGFFYMGHGGQKAPLRLVVEGTALAPSDVEDWLRDSACRVFIQDPGCHRRKLNVEEGGGIRYRLLHAAWHGALHLDVPVGTANKRHERVNRSSDIAGTILLDQLLEDGGEPFRSAVVFGGSSSVSE